MKKIALIFGFFMLFGCGGGKDSPKSPQASLLTFPLKNSECTTGEDFNGGNSSMVEFRWQVSENTESYELRATNLTTNISQTISTSSTSAKLPLEKGVPYSWNVTSKNTQVSQTTTSETWQFYNAGSQTSYAPFPAEILAPGSGASVLMDINNEVTLEWSGADVDDDIASYKVYFATTTPPQTIIATTTLNTRELKVSVATNTIYYWKIVTQDTEGNTSDSGIFQFKAL